MINVNLFRPKWTMEMTVPGAEKFFGTSCGFRFVGPGIYELPNGQVLYVAPVGAHARPWHQHWEGGQLFHFHVYDEDPYKAFQAMAAAPVRALRKDKR